MTTEYGYRRPLPNPYTSPDEERLYDIIERISEEVAQRAVLNALVNLGIDPRFPIDSQKDMATLRELRELYNDEEYRKDLSQLRAWRTNLDTIKSKGFFAAIGLVCAGGLALIIFALKGKFI